MKHVVIPIAYKHFTTVLSVLAFGQSYGETLDTNQYMCPQSRAKYFISGLYLLIRVIVFLPYGSTPGWLGILHASDVDIHMYYVCVVNSISMGNKA